MIRSAGARRLLTGIAAAIAVVAPASGVPAAASGVEAAQRRPNAATIVFEPAGPIAEGARYDVLASGFRPNTWVTVGASYDTVYWYSGITDSAGRVRLTLDARAAGTIRHEAWEQGAHQHAPQSHRLHGRHRQPVGRPFRT